MLNILKIDFHTICTNSNLSGYILFDFFFFLHLLGEFSHLCQLPLQLYTSVKSQTSLWHKKSTAMGFWCSKCSILSPVCSLHSLPVCLFQLEVRKEQRRKRGLKSPEKGSRRRYPCSMFSSVHTVHQACLLLSCTSDNRYPGPRQGRNEVEPKLVSYFLCWGWTYCLEKLRGAINT